MTTFSQHRDIRKKKEEREHVQNSYQTSHFLGYDLNSQKFNSLFFFFFFLFSSIFFLTMPRYDSEKKVPWKAILLAVALLSLGSLMLTLGFLLTFGWDKRYEDRGTPLLIIGSICFLPGMSLSSPFFFKNNNFFFFSRHHPPKILSKPSGFYVTRIAYYTVRVEQFTKIR